MRFPENFKCLSKNRFKFGSFEIKPIKYEDRIAIRQWRNEQMYHLRQKSELSAADQDHYFKTVVSDLFDQINPTQILFSFYKDNTHIGYGGLVHIEWDLKEAEISFIMNTSLEGDYFFENWSVFLHLIERVAFEELNLEIIRTYAYDLRPQLYKVLEANHFFEEARLKDEIEIDGDPVDVLLHIKKNRFKHINVRLAALTDEKAWLDLSNDPLVRANSYHQEMIKPTNHNKWFTERLQSKDAYLYIVDFCGESIANVKIEVIDETAVIGISLEPNARGKGLASGVLVKCCQNFHNERTDAIYAYIKTSNKASALAFKKAGFEYLKTEIIKESESLVYVLNKY